MRITDTLSPAPRMGALENYQRLTGPQSAVSRAMRSVSGASEAYGYLTRSATAKTDTVLAGYARGWLDETVTALSRVPRTAADDLATTVSRAARVGLADCGFDESCLVDVGRVRATRLPAGHAWSDSAQDGRAIHGGAAARARRDALAVRVRLREATAAVSGAQLTNAGLGTFSAVGARTALNGWQRTQLRRAERELLALRPAASLVPGLAREVQRQLDDVRSTLKADRLLAHETLMSTELAMLAAPSASLVGSAVATHARSRVVDPLAELSRVASRASAQARALGYAGPAEIAGLSGLLGLEKRARGAATQVAPVDAYLRNVSRAYAAGARGSFALPGVDPAVTSIVAAWSAGGVSLAGELDVLGSVVGDELIDMSRGEEAEARDQSLAGLIALVMWCRAAGEIGRERGRRATDSGRVLIAHTGAVMAELGGFVAGEARQAAELVWTGPLWSARAMRTLWPELTPEERVTLRQRHRQLGGTFGGVLAAWLAAYSPAGWAGRVVACLVAWYALQQAYEDVAGVCHAHGRDDLVPEQHRFWN